jgi:hypothetical protein
LLQPSLAIPLAKCLDARRTLAHILSKTVDRLSLSGRF